VTSEPPMNPRDMGRLERAREVGRLLVGEPEAEVEVGAKAKGKGSIVEACRLEGRLFSELRNSLSTSSKSSTITVERLDLVW